MMTTKKSGGRVLLHVKRQEKRRLRRVDEFMVECKGHSEGVLAADKQKPILHTQNKTTTLLHQVANSGELGTQGQQMENLKPTTLFRTI